MSAPAQPQPQTTIVYFDLETTGLSIKTAETIELAAEVEPAFKLQCADLPTTFATLVRPACATIPAEASNVNGIFMEDVKDAPVFGKMAEQFLHWMAQWRTKTSSERVVLIAHNCFKFDAPIFKRQCEEAGLALPEWLVFGDSLVVFRECFPYPRRRFALAMLIKLWVPKDQQISQEHRAASDVTLLMLVVRHCPDRVLFFRTLMQGVQK